MNLLSGHLTRLADFSGRENRQPFWLWILLVYAAQMVLSVVMMIPLVAGMSESFASLARYDQSYLDRHPEIATQVMMGVIGPFFRNILIFSGVMGLFLVALVAAAIVRRLHDTGRSGYWALPMLVLQMAQLLGYIIVFPRFFATLGSIRPDAGPEAANQAFASLMPLFGLVWLLGMAGFVFMVILIVFLASRGTVGPNRYGDDLLPPPDWPQPQPLQPAPPVQSWAEPTARVVRPWGDPPPDA